MNDKRPTARKAEIRLAKIHPIIDHPSRPEFAQARVGEANYGNDADGIAWSDQQRLVFNVDETARLLNVSRGLVYELVARGDLLTIRLGRRIVVPRTALEALLGTAIR